MTRQVGSRLTTTIPGMAPRLSLADAINGSKKLPSRIVFHAQAGVGKTSLAAHAPYPFFILSKGETGLHTLMDNGLAPTVPNIEIQDWLDVLPLIQQLQTDEHEYRTLVIDVLDGLEKLANEHVCRTDYGGDWSEKGFMGYYRGFKAVAAGPWKEFLNEIDKLREIRKMGVLLLAHTASGNFRNPTGADYDRYSPPMWRETWELTFGWADIVLFGYRAVTTEKERGERKAKAHGGGIRLISTEYDAAADAKNRHNLPPEIEMGNSGQEAWTNLVNALQAAKRGGKE